MKITMNMTDCRWDEERFLDGQDAADYLRKMELDGLELMHCQGGDPSFFPRPGWDLTALNCCTVRGEILLFFHPGWLPGCICVTGMTGWICGRKTGSR